MGRSFADEIVETSDTVGIGDYQLAGPKGNYFPFSSAFATGDRPVFVVRNKGNTKVEYNRGGAFTAGPPDTLERSVWKSSNDNAPVSWTAEDKPLTITIPASADLHEGVVTGWLAEARHALLRAGAFFFKSADLAVSWEHKLATGADTEVRLGLYDVGLDHYFADGRRRFTAVGAANRNVAVADIGYRFSFNTAAGARALILPAIDDAGLGFRVGAVGLSPANGIVVTPASGDAVDYGADGATLTIPGRVYFEVWSDGTQWRTDYAEPVIPDFITGLEIATAGASATFSITAGRCADKNGTKMMRRATTLLKTTGAWAVGTTNGALDTGDIANNTWYHAHLIERIDTGVVDALISLSATAPTLPADYTLSRYLGPIQTDGSAQWVKSTQIGDVVNRVMSADFTISGTSTATLRTFSVPTGVVVEPLFSIVAQAVNNNTGVIQFAPAADATLLFTASQTYEGSASNGSTSTTVLVGPPTNTSGQIYVAVPSTNGASMVVNCYGWIRRRNRQP